MWVVVQWRLLPCRCFSSKNKRKEGEEERKVRARGEGDGGRGKRPRGPGLTKPRRGEPGQRAAPMVDGRVALDRKQGEAWEERDRGKSAGNEAYSPIYPWLGDLRTKSAGRLAMLHRAVEATSHCHIPRAS
ncbi:hypothetical protein NL676_035712 [Syzygium grande]|nr:hypothetical protein NL676_035712 [Syzygium grande]